ncbi:hypothetical protein ACQPYA_02875 [Micromonospora sp. CA-263727]|uniref:hypothetical protein n=1 Tax=Micromonospora sp. CA-263727 TaxID=3239967 RepID=UPI003D906D29
MRTVSGRLGAAVLAVAFGAALAFFAAIVAPAQAAPKGTWVNWNSSSSPLTVTGYGSTARGYGKWRVVDNSQGTRSYTSGYYWYSNADNHKKYGWMMTQSNSGLCVAPQYTSCSSSYYNYTSNESSHSNTTGGQWLDFSTRVDPGGSYARAQQKVCLDVPVRSDPCSGATLTEGVPY